MTMGLQDRAGALYSHNQYKHTGDNGGTTIISRTCRRRHTVIISWMRSGLRTRIVCNNIATSTIHTTGKFLDRPAETTAPGGQQAPKSVPHAVRAARAGRRADVYQRTRDCFSRRRCRTTFVACRKSTEKAVGNLVRCCACHQQHL